MNVLVVEPGYLPYEKEINGLEEMQATVGGYIQAIYPYEEPVAIVCNEEGRLIDLPPNRAVCFEDSDEIAEVIHGTFFMAYAPEDAENYQSLPKELTEKYLDKFRYPEVFFKTREGTEVMKIVSKPASKDAR